MANLTDWMWHHLATLHCMQTEGHALIVPQGLNSCAYCKFVLEARTSYSLYISGKSWRKKGVCFALRNAVALSAHKASTKQCRRENQGQELRSLRCFRLFWLLRLHSSKLSAWIFPACVVLCGIIWDNGTQVFCCWSCFWRPGALNLSLDVFGLVVL